MEGLDKSWTYLEKNRNAYFTDLAPGTYVFKVKASNSSRVWNDKETRLIIQILPPWWASDWAYVFYITLAIVIIYYSFRYYHKTIEQTNRRKFDLLKSTKEKEVFNAKLEFFTNIAHEIRTPLTLIKAPLEKVIKKAEGTSDMKNLKIMERNTNHLINLTNQLLDFRETEIEGFRLSFAEANISELLEDVYTNFKPLAEQEHLNLELKLPQNQLYASVDQEAFNKILNNLFSNAIKYAESKVDVSLLRSNEQENLFTIEVKNDGFIIPFEMKNKIFEPFFRLKETQKQKGTGIGLALTKSLAQLHKGSLELKEPQENQNIFSLTLPIRQVNDPKVEVINALVDVATK
jgi:signal transduction histidine kinase